MSNQNKITLILEEFQSGKKQSALMKMRKFLKKYPDDFNTRYNYALMSQQNGDIKEAVYNYNKVILNDNKNWRALTNLYLIFFDQEKYNEGLKLVNKILEIIPDHQPTLRDKAHLQYYLDKPDEAYKNITHSFVALQSLSLNNISFSYKSSIYQ